MEGKTRKQLLLEQFEYRKSIAMTSGLAVDYADGKITEAEWSPIREERARAWEKIAEYNAQISKLEGKG